jgi:hypothetical protein
LVTYQSIRPLIGYIRYCPEEVPALLAYEQITDISDGFPKILTGSGSGSTQMVLSFEMAISTGLYQRVKR